METMNNEIGRVNVYMVKGVKINMQEIAKIGDNMGRGTQTGGNDLKWKQN